MAVQEILKMGNPKLLELSAKVEPFEFAALEPLIQDMIDTMESAHGAGLAAPQIGVLKRVVIFGFESNSRYPDAESVPFTVLINPAIERLGNEFDYGWEGCLSVPGMRGRVRRSSKIRYRGFNEKRERIDRTVSGFHARVVQHECDHLDGILYPMRIEDMTQFGFEDQLFESQLDCPATDSR